MHVYTNNFAPGLLLSQFFLGAAPASEDKLISLETEAFKQKVSYTALKVSDPQLGAYEALGKSFGETYPSKLNLTQSASDFITATYKSVIGTDPSAGALSNLVGQESYFKALYIADGATPEAAAISARGAVVGQILGYAAQDDANAYTKGAGNFLADYYQDGEVTYGQALGEYKPAVETVTVTVPGPGVPYPVPTDPDAVVVNKVNAILDVSSHKPGVLGEVNIGGQPNPQNNSGNFANNYQRETDTVHQIDGSFKAHVRTGLDYLAGNDNGMLFFNVKGGEQVPGPGGLDAGYAQSVSGSGANLNNRSHFSIDYSIDLGFRDIGTTDLVIQQKFDLDPSIAVVWKTLTFDGTVVDGTERGVWRDEAGVAQLGNDGGRANSFGHVIQDSVNYGFGFLSNNIVGGVGPNGAGDLPEGAYDYQLLVTSAAGKVYIDHGARFYVEDTVQPVGVVPLTPVWPGAVAA